MQDLRVRIAEASDLSWLEAQDPHIARAEQARKVAAGHVVVAERGGELVGLLRLDLLWSRYPFIALVRVQEEHRRRGVGRAFLRFLDDHLASLGFDTLLSSSTGNEPEPQAWHRHMGFVECGVILGLNEGGVGEVFFRRRIGAPIG